jgi:FXSXX-COOH protein
VAPPIETALPDLRGIPLGDVPGRYPALDAVLERLVDVPRVVPVAGFNSSLAPY